MVEFGAIFGATFTSWSRIFKFVTFSVTIKELQIQPVPYTHAGIIDLSDDLRNGNG